MMIAVLATLRVKDGAVAEFEAIFGELARKVREREPGNELYQLTRARDFPNTYKILELYADQSALEAHGQSEHFRDLGRRMGAHLDGRPAIEYLDAIG